MEHRYRYKPDLRTWYATALHVLVFAAIAVALFLTYDGGYMLAWGVGLIIALIALMALSIPRRVELSDESIEIYCISDFTSIDYSEIASVRPIDKSETRFFVPLFAGVGFFGYYGYFLNLRKLDIVKIYASKWCNFVEITDICEDKYYISCDNPDEFTAFVEKRIGKNRETDE